MKGFSFTTKKVNHDEFIQRLKELDIKYAIDQYTIIFYGHIIAMTIVHDKINDYGPMIRFIESIEK